MKQDIWLTSINLLSILIDKWQVIKCVVFHLFYRPYSQFALEASFQICYRIVRTGPNNAVSRRIKDFANSMKIELLKRINLNYFALQLDETGLIAVLIDKNYYVSIILYSSLSDAAKIVNFIKQRATNSHLFNVVCEDLESLHILLLPHTGVTWFSSGKVLTRLFELKVKVFAFFLVYPFHLSSCAPYIRELAYLVDICSKLNVLKLSL